MNKNTHKMNRMRRRFSAGLVVGIGLCEENQRFELFVREAKAIYASMQSIKSNHSFLASLPSLSSINSQESGRNDLRSGCPERESGSE